ncbi:MAG: YhfC family intramembrane metalloprotease [Ruminococcus sp.]|nr:YhfC family intramembrane metalloprotease [Ruminococcus sp.]
MDSVNISGATIIGYGITGIVSILMPFILAIIWKRITDEKYFAAFVGAFGFFCAATVRILLRAMLLGNSSPLRESPFAFYVTNALISGVLEETARLLCFKYPLKNKSSRSVSVMHGIGHDGFESITAIGIVSFQYVSYLSTAKSIGIEAFMKGLSETEAQNVADGISSLADQNFFSSLFVTLGSVSGAALHIALSVIVFSALQQFEWKKLFLLAVGLHTFADILPYFEHIGLITMEGVTILDIIFTAAVSWFAYKKYQELPYI